MYGAIARGNLPENIRRGSTMRELGLGPSDQLPGVPAERPPRHNDQVPVEFCQDTGELDGTWTDRIETENACCLCRRHGHKGLNAARPAILPGVAIKMVIELGERSRRWLGCPKL